MSNPKKSKVILAVGGTGGHLFPAQALARDLKDMEILFAGSGLSKNRYFLKNAFPYKEVQSGTFLTSNLRRNIKGIFSLIKGFYESLKLFKEFQPDLVVGFGSYHVFPLLLAATFKKIPMVLFASDTIPGKVIRFFSKKALISAVQFEEAKKYLKGNTIAVNIPFWSQGNHQPLTRSEACAYYQLDNDCYTLLIFGGSQGAQALNQIAAQISLKVPFQVLHFVGHEKNVGEIEESYKKRGIKACVKPFEEKMHYAWTAADLAICRAGAATLAEILFYEVPAILVPYPYAADDHQKMNAQVFEKAGGTLMLIEKELSAEKLSSHVEQLPLSLMKEKLKAFKQKDKKEDLSTIIKKYL